MKKTKLSIYAISIYVLLHNLGCQRTEPRPCPSSFEYTTAAFTAHEAIVDTNTFTEINTNRKQKIEIMSITDTFPAGTDLVCQAEDLHLTTYEWTVEPGYYLWSDTINDPVILNNKDNKIIVKYDDIRQYLTPENNFTMILRLKCTRPARICKPCDEGYDIRGKYITYSGLSPANNMTNTKENTSITDSTIAR